MPTERNNRTYIKSLFSRPSPTVPQSDLSPQSDQGSGSLCPPPLAIHSDLPGSFSGHRSNRDVLRGTSSVTGQMPQLARNRRAKAAPINPEGCAFAAAQLSLRLGRPTLNRLSEGSVVARLSDSPAMTAGRNVISEKAVDRGTESLRCTNRFQVEYDLGMRKQGQFVTGQPVQVDIP